MITLHNMKFRMVIDSNPDLNPAILMAIFDEFGNLSVTDERQKNYKTSYDVIDTETVKVEISVEQFEEGLFPNTTNSNPRFAHDFVGYFDPSLEDQPVRSEITSSGYSYGTVTKIET